MPIRKGLHEGRSGVSFLRYFSEISAKVYYNVVDLLGKRKFKLNILDEYELGWHIIVKCRGKKYTTLSINNIS